MLPRHYRSQCCPIARALEVVGDRWTLLVVREAFWGTSRFEDFHRQLGIARTVLTDRLGRLVEDGVMVRVAYSERPERFEYRLTDKGLALWPVLMDLLAWGDRYEVEGPSPVAVVHRACGGALDERRMCTRCGAPLGPGEVEMTFLEHRCRLPA